MTEFIVALVTCSSEQEAERLASRLVEEKLAACVNVTPVTSYFRWQGKPNQQNEKLLIIKTKSSLFDNLERRVKELHTYEVPEVIAFPVVAGSEKYLHWIRDSVAGK